MWRKRAFKWHEKYQNFDQEIKDFWAFFQQKSIKNR
jgi:hypothetical protein